MQSEATSENCLHSLAMGKFAQNELDWAISILNFLLVNFPDNSDALSLRGHCLEKGGFILDAIADYEKVIQLTNDGNIKGLLGACFSRLADNKKAIYWLKQAVDEGYDNYSYLLEMCRLINDDILAITKKDAENEGLFRKRINKDDWRVFNTDLLKTYLEDDYQKIDKLLKQDPDNPLYQGICKRYRALLNGF